LQYQLEEEVQTGVSRKITTTTLAGFFTGIVERYGKDVQAIINLVANKAPVTFAKNGSLSVRASVDAYIHVKDELAIIVTLADMEVSA